MTSPIPVAVVGAGRVAHAVYLPLLAAMPEIFAVVAVVETDPGRSAVLERVCPGVPIGSDIAYAAKQGARAAIVATPWFTHTAVVEECLGFGLPVLCEKPVSLDPRDIEHLVRVSASTGLPVSAGYMKRHDQAVIALIRHITWAADGLRQITARILDPNAAHQIAHLVTDGVTPAAGVPMAAAEVAEHILGPASATSHRTAYLHGLGGSLVHQVNIINTAFRGTGHQLLNSLAFATEWASGTAVSAGWRPTADLGVEMSHVRVPLHRAYREIIEVVTETSRAELVMPSPYARDAAGRLSIESWDSAGGSTTTEVRPPIAATGFAGQLSAWADFLERGGDPLPGLADALDDAAVICEAARNLGKKASCR